MSDVYKFVVCCRNVAIGIFPSMAMAVESIEQTMAAQYDSPKLHEIKMSEFYAEFSAPHHQFTIVGCRESNEPGDMF